MCHTDHNRVLEWFVNLVDDGSAAAAAAAAAVVVVADLFHNSLSSHHTSELHEMESGT